MIDREPRMLLVQILAWGLATVAAVSVVGALVAGLPSGVGLLSGGSVTLVSFWWLGSIGVKLVPHQSKKWARFIVLTLLRYLVIVAILVVLIRTPGVSLSALALGLAVPLPIIAWKGVQSTLRVEDVMPAGKEHAG